MPVYQGLCGCLRTPGRGLLAEGVGFEPTLRFPVNTLSKRAPSATRPSLRIRCHRGAGMGFPDDAHTYRRAPNAAAASSVAPPPYGLRGAIKSDAAAGAL